MAKLAAGQGTTQHEHGSVRHGMPRYGRLIVLCRDRMSDHHCGQALHDTGMTMGTAARRACACQGPKHGDAPGANERDAGRRR